MHRSAASSRRGSLVCAMKICRPRWVDRAKGVTLHGLASVLLGSQSPAGQLAVRLITDEEAGVRNGATTMVGALDTPTRLSYSFRSRIAISANDS